MNKSKKPIIKPHPSNGHQKNIKTMPSVINEKNRITTAISEIRALGKSLQLKDTAKSIQLKKVSTTNHKKKSLPCKSSAKISKKLTYQVESFKTITQTFKQSKLLKLAQEKLPSKSKSPPSLKSRSASKYPPSNKNKIRTAISSERILALKLHKTMKLVNMSKFMAEDSIPMRSNSSRNQEHPFINITSENEESINIAELQNYYMQMKEKERLEPSAEKILESRQNKAAIKIQRAWRRRQTRLLVERYSSLIAQEYQGQQIFMNTGSITLHHYDLQSQDAQQQIIVTFEDNQQPLSGGVEDVHEVRGRENYEEMIERFKREEVQRWDELISIISLNRKGDPSHISRLLQTLTEQSEINKRNLQAMTCEKHQTCKKQNTKFGDKASQPKRHQNQAKKQIIISSDRSIEPNDYDNKKYIGFLDADIFPHTTASSHRQISKAKQDLLLDTLKNSHAEGGFALNHSESLKDMRTCALKIELDIGHKRTVSDKTNRNVFSSRRVIDEEKMDHVCVDELIKQFLESQDPHSKEGTSIKEDNLRTKLDQLNKMRKQFQDEEKSSSGKKSDLQPGEIIFRPSITIHQVKQQEPGCIKVADSSNKSFQSFQEDFQHLFEQEEQNDEIKNAQYDTCAAILLDKLVMETLKDFTKSDIICEAFRNYFHAVKVASKNESNKKRKGFSTSKAEIQMFIASLLKYLEKQQPNIFKNLQVPTGPTALEMLRYMHESVEEEEESSDEDEASIMVIPNRIFDAFWSNKEKSIVIDVPETVDKTATIFRQQIDLLKSLNKIFYRNLFDTFNQCLDCERNFGQYGRPFPWKRIAVFNHEKSSSVLQNHVENAEKRMMELSVTYCGLMVQKEDVGSLDEDYIKQIHEERLSRMLAGDFLQGEDRWIFYDDEETQILVEISNNIWKEQILQAMQEFYALN